MSNVLFVLESFRRHMDNGRWLFQLGMEAAGWRSAGSGCPAPAIDSVNVRAVCEGERPRIVLFWPRYEWDYREWVGSEVKPEHGFNNWEWLLDHEEITRVVVWHDAGSAREQQRRWHEAFRPHVYLSWYHPQSVLPFADYVPPSSVVRTYHIVDADALPPVRLRDRTAIVSGALSPCVYPLRTNCAAWATVGILGAGVDVLRHPGYPQTGSVSNAYLSRLSQYRVAICTCSAYRFALRKIFEATAVGCKVITDLPEYDALPEIDGNLIRVPSDIDADAMREVIAAAVESWRLDEQIEYAERARKRYDYRAECARLYQALEDFHEVRR